MEDAPEAANSGRSRGRRNVIGASPHREDYERLIRNGWDSLSLERYASYRYGEDIPASTFRTYKSRKKMSSQVKAPEGAWGQIEVEGLPDVLKIRAEMIELQRRRIAVDWTHEQSMSKLFGSTKGELAALGQMLDAMKADLQDVGIMSKAGEKIEVTQGMGLPSAEAGAPRQLSLGALIGSDDPEAVHQMARVLHIAAGDYGKKSVEETG